MGNQETIRRRLLAEREANRLADERMQAVNPLPMATQAAQGGGTAGLRAKAQEPGQADGKLSVKFVNESGSAYGSAFDVFAFPDQSATDMTEYLPSIPDGKVLFIKRVQGEWYLDWTPNEFNTITVQTNYDFSDPNFQIKTRANVKVFSADAESGWSTKHSGTDCPV